MGIEGTHRVSLGGSVLRTRIEPSRFSRPEGLRLGRHDRALRQRRRNLGSRSALLKPECDGCMMGRATVPAGAAIQQGIDDGGRKSMRTGPDGDGSPGRAKPLDGLLGSPDGRSMVV